MKDLSPQSQPSCPTGLSSNGAPSQDVAATSTIFTGHTASAAVGASAQSSRNIPSPLSAPGEQSIGEDHPMEDIPLCFQMQAHSSQPSQRSADPPSHGAPSQDDVAAGAASTGHAAALPNDQLHPAQTSQPIARAIVVPSQQDIGMDTDMDDESMPLFIPEGNLHLICHKLEQ
jgi:hypothetical protein